ncbi:MAG: archaemetzincin family Zn-dependent metalloprotease [Desulfobacterales bacterium]
MNPEPTIIISPIGEFSSELIEAVAREIKRVFGFAAKSESVLQDLDFALDQNRNQYHSTVILEHLAANRPARALRVIAITQVDLFIPILTHVYGEAQLGGTACIVSTYRLNEGRSGMNILPKFIDRIAKEAIHELGHTFKLRHCPEHTCIMHYCRNEEDVDRKSDQLCRYCKVMLADEIKRMR